MKPVTCGVLLESQPGGAASTAAGPVRLTPTAIAAAALALRAKLSTVTLSQRGNLFTGPPRSKRSNPPPRRGEA